MIKNALILFTLVLGFLSTPKAFSKDLTNRLGIGYRDAFSFSLPSIAAIYYPNDLYGVVGSIGLDTEEDNSKSAFSAGVRRIIFKEDQMNFFMAGMLSILSQETLATGTKSGYELSALVGGEFFLSGLESLGFNFETGVGVTNIQKVRFRTVGDHMLRAGVVFYF